MRAPVLLLLCGLLAAGTLTAQTSEPAEDPFALAPAPLSTKIWDDFSWPNLSGKAHRALGYAAVTLGAAAWLAGKLYMEDDQANAGRRDLHQFLGVSAGVTAGSNALLGLVGHWDKLTFEGDLLTWHNLHGLAAGAGTASMVAAALLGGQDNHQTFGLLGTVLMAVAIVLEG